MIELKMALDFAIETTKLFKFPFCLSGGFLSPCALFLCQFWFPTKHQYHPSSGRTRVPPLPREWLHQAGRVYLLCVTFRLNWYQNFWKASCTCTWLENFLCGKIIKFGRSSLTQRGDRLFVVLLEPFLFYNFSKHIQSKTQMHTNQNNSIKQVLFKMKFKVTSASP